MSAGQTPKVEPYDGYLFAVFKGADAEVDCFVGQTFLVTVHWRESKAIAELADNAKHNANWMAEGSVGLFHRVADAVVDGVRPAIDALRERVERLETAGVFEKPSPSTVKELLAARADVFALGGTRAGRSATPSIDATRREFYRYQHRNGIPIPRRLRSSRPHRRRCGGVARSTGWTADCRGRPGRRAPLDLNHGHGKNQPAPARSRQPDRRRRGDRASRVDRQGARRERHRRRRQAPDDPRRDGRQAAGPRRRRRGRDGAGRCAAGDRASRDQQDPASRRPRIDFDHGLPR